MVLLRVMVQWPFPVLPRKNKVRMYVLVIYRSFVVAPTYHIIIVSNRENNYGTVKPLYNELLKSG